MNARRIIAWIVGAATLLALVAIYGGFALPKPAAPQPVGVGEESDRVHALGRLEPASRVRRIAAPSGSEGMVVSELLVAEGDEVEAGQVLALLDLHDRKQAALLEAQAKVAQAEANLDQTRAGAKTGDIEAKRAAVQVLAAQARFARRQLDRARQLHQSNSLTAEELENRQWVHEKALLEQQQAEQTLAAIEEVREIDVKVREQELAVAKAAVARAEADVAATQVRAPAAGQVLSVHARSGERIGDRGLLDLADVARMQAVAEVFEADVARVRVGQAAEVAIDSSRERLRGVVAELGFAVARKDVLSNDPVSDTDARVIEVRIDLAPEDASRVARLTNARIEATIDVGSTPRR
jgi:HlyD family secretion protein